MEGHTPGPWRVGDAGHTVFGPNLGKPSPEVIANLGAREAFRANARLIAAAPELLAALELAEATIERLNRHNSANGTLHVVRAAIHKATEG